MLLAHFTHHSQSDEAVEMIPGLADSHPATTHVVKRDALSPGTTCSGNMRPHAVEAFEHEQ